MERAPTANLPTEQKKFSEDLDLILQEIEKNFFLSEEERQAFIQKRLEKLEGGTEKVRELSMWGKRMHKGYISKDTGVQRNMMVDPFYMDDPSLFESFLNTYKEIRENPSWASMPPRQVMVAAVQFALQKYFGNMFPTTKTESRNRDFYLSQEHPEGKISIGDFKGKNMAVCAEKASAAQNILSFVGMDTYTLLSGDCRLSGEEEGGAHLFNIFNSGNGYRLYDPTNPVLYLDKDSNVISASPAIYPLTDAQFEQLLSNGEVEVEHKDVQNDEVGNRKEIPVKRIYGGVPQELKF